MHIPILGISDCLKKKKKQEQENHWSYTTRAALYKNAATGSVPHFQKRKRGGLLRNAGWKTDGRSDSAPMSSASGELASLKLQSNLSFQTNDADMHFTRINLSIDLRGCLSDPRTLRNLSAHASPVVPVFRNNVQSVPLRPVASQCRVCYILRTRKTYACPHLSR